MTHSFRYLHPPWCSHRAFVTICDHHSVLGFCSLASSSRQSRIQQRRMQRSSWGLPPWPRSPQPDLHLGWSERHPASDHRRTWPCHGVRPAPAVWTRDAHENDRAALSSSVTTRIVSAAVRLPFLGQLVLHCPSPKKGLKLVSNWSPRLKARAAPHVLCV